MKTFLLDGEDLPKNITPRLIYSDDGNEVIGVEGEVSYVSIPEGVTSIGDFAFEDCESLTSVVIPASVTSIGKCAFHLCKSLTSIVIPEGVTSIGDYAFKNCSSLTSVVIPEGVTSIGDGAFIRCRSLKEIHVRMKSLKHRNFGKELFPDCIYKDCVLYVPKGRKWSYRFHKTFWRFKKIRTEE